MLRSLRSRLWGGWFWVWQLERGLWGKEGGSEGKLVAYNVLSANRDRQTHTAGTPSLFSSER